MDILLLPGPKFQRTNGKTLHHQGRVCTRFAQRAGFSLPFSGSFVIRNASQWCRSPASVPADMSLAAYAVRTPINPYQHPPLNPFYSQDLQRILTRSLDLLYSGTSTASGLQLDSDYLLVITTMETQILAWQHEWVNIRKVGSSKSLSIDLTSSHSHFL